MSEFIGENRLSEIFTLIKNHFVAKSQVATSSTTGLVKPDGTTTTVDANGVLSASGSSVPSGGTTGQVLSKHSNTDQDVEWSDIPEETQSISLSDFKNLTPAQKNNGKAYFVYDGISDGQLASCGFTPIGTIISVMGKTAPANYLVCDGTVYNIVDYPELAKYFKDQFEVVNKFGGDGTTTFAVPDLRGEFLRGTGTNSHTNQGNGANVGVHQDGTLMPMVGLSTSGTALFAPQTSTADILPTSMDKYYAKNGTGKGYIFAGTGPWNATSDNVFTSRPTNTSVLYCIATHNIYVDAKYDFSTDEKVVGTWIDGKPIYQKTIVTKWPDVSVSTAYDVSINAIVDTIVELKWISDIDGICKSSFDIAGVSNEYMMKVVIFNNTYSDSNLRNKIRAWNNNPTNNNKTVYVTLQYTKTID